MYVLKCFKHTHNLHCSDCRATANQYMGIFINEKKKHPDFIFTFKRAGCVVVTKVKLN